MSKMRIVYFQSGGPTAVINSSLCGVVKEAKKHPDLFHSALVLQLRLW